MSTPMNIPPDLPPEVIPVLVEMGYLEADRLQPGDTAPQLALECPGTGDSALVGGQHNSQPTVLIFGSYT